LSVPVNVSFCQWFSIGDRLREENAVQIQSMSIVKLYTCEVDWWRSRFRTSPAAYDLISLFFLTELQ
jgi:hypothetical protein